MDEKSLLRAASSGDPKKIQALAQFRGKEGRDPALYPWAGDQWKRMHWRLVVQDPCVFVEEHGKQKRFVAVSENFRTKGSRESGGGPPRDPTGRVVPAAQKLMPWAEWIWFTGTGGIPVPMRGWRANKMPATCIYQVPPTQIAAPPPPPAPSPVPQGGSPCVLGKNLDHDVLSCAVCLKHALANLEQPPPPPPPPPNAPHVPSSE